MGPHLLHAADLIAYHLLTYRAWLMGPEPGDPLLAPAFRGLFTLIVLVGTAISLKSLTPALVYMVTPDRSERGSWALAIAHVLGGSFVLALTALHILVLLAAVRMHA